MKRFMLKMLTVGTLTLAGSAFADTDVVANSIMNVQLNPIMQDALTAANTSITIRHFPFIVVAPATCVAKTCTVVLDYMYNDPKTFIVIHENNEGNKSIVKAKVITIFPQELYQMSYELPAIKGTALTVTDIHRLYR